MKYQIRQGVFETNSSSTHSMQIVDSSINDPKKIVKAIIEEAYKERYRDEQFDKSEYFYNNILTLEPLHFEDSDEDKVVIYLIKNTIAKIEYLFMDLLNYVYSFDSLQEVNEFGYHSKGEIKKYLESSSQYKWFIDAVADFVKEHLPQIKINEIVLGDYDGYFEGTYCEETIFNYENIKTEESVRDKVFEVLDEKYVILDKDVAYSPYNPPIVITY